RFIGVLIEHFAGDFPLWLAPIQCAVLPITDAQLPYAKDIHRQMSEAGIRAELDDRNEKIGYKIREWETRKVRYMIVTGAKEAADGTVSVRVHKKGDSGAMPAARLIERLSAEISEKRITS